MFHGNSYFIGIYKRCVFLIFFILSLNKYYIIIVKILRVLDGIFFYITVINYR